MRRNDSAGKALGATLRGHQVVAGISKSFLNVPPEDIPYMPRDTRWAYMATLTTQYEINIQCYNEWLPKHKCRGDRVIMDTALQDEYFTNKKWKLEIINNCRLFLQVINLSDMAINNEELDNEYYNGGKRVTRNDIVFEDVIDYFKDLTTVYVLLYEKSKNNTTKKIHISSKRKYTRRTY